MMQLHTVRSNVAVASDGEDSAISMTASLLYAVRNWS